MSVTKETYCGCLFYSANALARTLGKMADKAFASTGLAPSLGFIVMTVNRHHGVTAGALASDLQLDASTITRLVDKLEQGGYVTRRSDGRFTQLFPTAKAGRLDAPLRSAWRDLHRGYSELLGEAPSAELTNSITHATTILSKEKL